MISNEHSGIVLGELLSRVAAERKEANAVIFEDRRLSYRELDENANRMASALVNLGLKKGDRVGIWLQNIPEWVVSWFGISRAGGVVVPMDHWYKPSEAEYILKHSGAVGVVSANMFGKARFLPMINEIRPHLPELKHVIVVKNEDGFEPDPSRGEVTFDRLLEMGSDHRENTTLARVGKEMDPDDVAFMLYTSGTTGNPKGAMLTHNNIIRNAWDGAQLMELTGEDRFFIPIPFSHCFGNVLSLTMAVSIGASLFPMTVFNPERALQLIEEHRITVCHGVPTMFIRELEVLERKKYDTSSLKTGIMAGAPCPVDTMQSLIDDMGFNVCIGYGLTEASPLITMTTLKDDLRHRVETVGKAIPGVEVRIVDTEHKEVPIGETGELACRGYNVMKGYYKMPEQTAEAIDADGWLYTGDLATEDEGGYFRIVGRMKDMVIVGGFNVYPVEIENFLIEHPRIINATIVGVPDHDLGEIVAAVVEGEEGLTARDVVDHCFGKMNKFAVPRYVSMGMTIPISGRGKVQKYLLRQELARLIEAGELERIVPTKLLERK